MSLLFTLSIRQGLAALVVLLALFFTAAGVVISRGLEQVVETAQLTVDRRVPQLMDMAQLELGVTRVSLQLRHAMLSRTPEELNATLQDIAARRKAFGERLDAYERGLSTPTARERFAGVRPAVDHFWQVGEANIQLIVAGRKDEAFAFLIDNTIPARNRLLEQFAQTVGHQRDALVSSIESIQTEARRAEHAVLGLLALAFLTVLGATVVLMRFIRRRLTHATQAATRVRDGDLATPIVDERRDELSPLFSALAEMRAGLAGVVGTVRRNARHVAASSAEISDGNQDLAARTEEQSSALQQTAATMEQLGTTVRHNAEHARQAEQLAQGASTVAQQGGEVVGQVVSTMQGISDSSRRIGDIIGVIDGIAFQTNILALNAAVEAARAGEQGRGFAVVASEVRTLAQRSAEAAKEIKALIGNSVSQVEQGAQLVDRAGRTMNEIVGAIRRVSDIVSEITTASAEQRSGVEQVGLAVTQMDETTQRNAAMVERSAVSAATLKDQAEQLVRAVEVFRVDAGLSAA
jgi:methyl-accepting chemotaxis protein